ncbi:hydroxymethylbilane synthase [Mesosutterella sp. OilRF-GAM-744-9]|uniref:Porphobilinogen deaminase n=1 Tax=Mesosutterella porci TaxID=2915351 RepID=A0ABS9MVB4_9BURK|nr:hydroxymethylbilane synthase [Mesosutterella sp. oilRF-744-WT-GAM-9]MCG5031943.1 hydroxymethylbilane synthase [Mesosutterella sp. oilRF-744-WT-GAM-9]MCI6531033.1 hydroxymethylbilane synthase [Mesosutterella sp.]
MAEMKKCVIATRESPLAMWQAVHVKELLERHSPGMEVELSGMTTKGDRILDKTLSKIGGKGLFVVELEAAIREGKADLAVHSLKDIPMELSEGFVLAAVSSREDPRDAFVSGRYASLEEMPAGAVVGTASLRRELMVRCRYPHLVVRPVRGNVGTRLRKLDEGQYDALVMASAGLKRLGLSERIRSVIEPEVSLPSPGQGALGIEVAQDNLQAREAVAFINDAACRACTAAEREVSRALGGSCQVPLAAYAVPEGDGGMWLRAMVGNHRTGEAIFAETHGRLEAPLEAAAEVLGRLRAEGAERILKEVLEG